jgi:hypothetical protein
MLPLEPTIHLEDDESWNNPPPDDVPEGPARIDSRPRIILGSSPVDSALVHREQIAISQQLRNNFPFSGTAYSKNFVEEST